MKEEIKIKYTNKLSLILGLEFISHHQGLGNLSFFYGNISFIVNSMKSALLGSI